MQLEQLITICGFLIALGTIIWKASEIKNNLKEDIDERLDNYKTSFLELQAKVDLLAQNFENEINTQNNRVNSLHSYSKGKIKDLQYKFNEVVGYLEKVHPGNKFIIRSRIMTKQTMNED